MKQLRTHSRPRTLVAVLLLVGGPIPAEEFLRGDANGSGVLDISDAVVVLQHLLAGGVSLNCPSAADTNDDGLLDVTDALHLLHHLFLGGATIASPFPGCGVDPTPDELRCPLYRPCSPEMYFLPVESPESDPCAFEDEYFVSAEGGCKDLVTTLVWARGQPESQWTWDPAVSVCDNLAAGGFTDWSLPTVEHLQRMAADGNYLHLPIDGSASYGYWSEETRGNRAWRVILGGPRNGETGLVLKVSSMFVLCVREGESPPSLCGNGTCDPGEDCSTCSDCEGRSSGSPSKRFCCGNGVTEGPEAADPTLCDGND